MDEPIRGLREADLDRVLLPLGSATNLPSTLYADERIWRLERREIFGRMWLSVGRQEDLPEAGSFFTRELAGRSVIVVRGGGGTVRAFHNVCRHRGSCLVEAPEGRAKAFRCGYHGWTYDTEGALIAAPLMNERAGFDPEDWPLSPVRCDSWGGFLFVNLDEAAPPLARAMADFPSLERYRLEDLRRVDRKVYEVAANWKVLCENYSECYHCALVHPQLNRVTDYLSGGRSVFGDCYNGGPMELNEGMESLTMNGRAAGPPLPGLDQRDRRLVHYYNLYPQFLIGLCPDYVVQHTVWPLAPDRSTVICDWLFPADTATASDLDPSEVVEFWDTTNRQDWKLCEGVQRAAGSSGARPGPYHSTEACVHAFDSWYVRRLRKELGALVG